jgi:hypothetical protein
MKEIMDDNKPTAQEMGMSEEFVYATRIVEVLKKVDLNKPCDIRESVMVIQKAFLEYKKKILDYDRYVRSPHDKPDF